DAPDNVTDLQRSLGSQKTVVAQHSYHDSTPNDQLAGAPQDARRRGNNQEHSQQDCIPTRHHRLREIEEKKRADVNQFRYAFSRLYRKEARQGGPSDEQTQRQVEYASPAARASGNDYANEPREHDDGNSD